MKYSKYTSKFDPKHNAAQPAPMLATVEVPSATPALHAKPAVAVVALQPATQLQIEAAPQPDHPAPKGDGQDAVTVINAGSAQDDSSEAMVSEGAPAHAGQPGHAVTGDATTRPAAHMEDSAEKTPTLSAMPLC